MATIKTESFDVENKTYTIKAWKSSTQLIVQAFQGATPVNYQIVMDTIQLDDVRMYYSADPVEMLIKNVKRFVEECSHLGIINQFMLKTDKIPNQTLALA